MQHLARTPQNFLSRQIVKPFRKTLFSLVAGAVTLGSLSGSDARAATAVKPTRSAGAAFCRQVKASQTSIAEAAGTPIVKLTAIGAEWTKIAATAPPDIKADVLVVRGAYVEAAKAGVDTAAKAPAVASAGAKISSYFAQTCGGGIAGAAGQGGPDGEGGPGRGGNSPERIAYRECLTKNGVTLPAPGQGGPNGGPPNGAPAGVAGTKGTGVKPASANGAAGTRGSAAKPPVGAKPVSGGPVGVGAANGGGGRGGFGLDPSDPAVAKAMKACESLRPAGGFGGDRGGFGNPAIRACLTKKGVTIDLA